MSELFRAEAVEGQRQSWLGEVRLVRPLSLTLLTAFAVSVAALLIGYLFVGEVARKARLSGVLVAAAGSALGGGSAQGLLQASLLAPPETIGLLRADQPVLLRYEAFGPQAPGRHAGKIVQVSRTPESRGDHPGCVGRPDAEPVYRVTAALGEQELIADGKPQALAAGMRVEAEVRLDRRRLVDWLFSAGRG